MHSVEVTGALADVVDREQLAALVVHARDTLGSVNLAEKEVVALRLYTWPGFIKLNGSLRHSSSLLPAHLFQHLRGNTYVNTLHALVSGLTKLMQVSAIPEGREVFRGMQGFKLPECFWTKDAFSAKGCVDFACMSSTTNMDVAQAYSEGRGSLVFRIQVGMIDSGADIEVLMPPRSCLEVVGEPYPAVSGSGQAVTVVPARINCNLRGQTLEQIRGQRKALCLSMLHTLQREVDRDLWCKRASDEFQARVEEDDKWLCCGSALLAGVTELGAAEERELERRDDRWFTDDACFHEAVARILGYSKLATTKVRQYIADRAVSCEELQEQSFVDVARRER